MEQLIHQLGDRDLVRAIEDVAEAELSRVFASIHLEQISSASVQKATGPVRWGGLNVKILQLFNHYVRFHLLTQPIFFLQQPDSVFGKESLDDSCEGRERARICERVIQAIKPVFSSWGVSVNNFQLESTALADPTYAGTVCLRH